MRSIFTLLKSIIFVLVAILLTTEIKAQDFNGYNVIAKDLLEAKALFVIDGDTLTATTQVTLNDTVIVTLEYLENNYPDLLELTDSLATMDLQRVSDNGYVTDRALTTAGLLATGQVAIASALPALRFYENDVDIGWDIHGVSGDLIIYQTNTNDNGSIIFKDTTESNVIIFNSDDASVYASKFLLEPTYVMTGNEEIGALYWNDAEGFYEIRVSADVTIPIDGGTFYAKAETAIENGQPVMYAGTQGGHPLVKPVAGNLAELRATPHKFLGLATQDILINAFGYIAVEALLNNVYTNTPDNNDDHNWSASSILYLDWGTGWLTDEMPTPPDPIITVAIVQQEQVGAAENGKIFTRPLIVPRMVDLSDVNGTPPVDGSFPVYNFLGQYFDFNYRVNNDPYSSDWDGRDTMIPTFDNLYDKLSQFESVNYCTDSAIVNFGTITTGSQADLCVVDGNDLVIAEVAPNPPFQVDFLFQGVERLQFFSFYGDYDGGQSHQVHVLAYNVNTLTWDFIGEFGASAVKRWYSFPIYVPNNYINGLDEVKIRVEHQGTGVTAHRMYFDYVEVNFGGTGGGNFTTAGSTDFTPYLNITSTNVQGAIQQFYDLWAASVSNSTQWDAAYTHSQNDADIDTTNEIQDLVLTGDILSLTKDPTTVNLDKYLDNTDDQVLTTTGSVGHIAIENGNAININVNDSDADPTNEVDSIYDANQSKWLLKGDTIAIIESSGGSGGAGYQLDTLTVPSHGFVVNKVIAHDTLGNIIYAIADTSINADAFGIIKEIIDVNTFSYQSSGIFKQGTWTEGANYFLSTTSPGDLVTSQTYNDYDIYLWFGTGTANGLEVNIGTGTELVTSDYATPGSVSDSIQNFLTQSEINVLIGDTANILRAEWQSDISDIDLLIQQVANGNKSTSFIHYADSASIGNYNLTGTGAYTISVYNLQSGHMATMYLHMGATLPSSIALNYYTDAGTTQISGTNVYEFGTLDPVISEVTSVTYTCASDGTTTEMMISYGQSE